LGSSRLAIANPDIAPYGTAARQMLLEIALWDRVQPRLVFGENIAQTLQFVASGNAQLGLIAVSQVNDARLPEASCLWHVPPEMHQPIEQQAIILRRAAANTVAVKFLSFLAGSTGRAIIARHGYLLPGQER
jgi:molybdate transport system substrate-binding protein